MVASGYRETTAFKLIVIYISELGQMLMTYGKLSNRTSSVKAGQWLMLQLCQVTVGVAEWIE